MAPPKLSKILYKDIYFQPDIGGGQKVSFPVMECKTSVTQKFGTHEYYLRDGDYIEPTGCSSIRVDIQSDFSNFMSPQAGERWEYGQIFNAFRNLQNSLRLGAPGVLKHPYLGPLDCVLTSMEDTLSSTKTSGPSVSMTFIETIKPDVFDTLAVGTNSVFTDGSFTEAVYKPAQRIPELQKDSKDLFDTLNDISGAIDRITFQAGKYKALGDRAIFFCEKIKGSINRMNNTAHADIKCGVNRIQRQLYEIQEAATKISKTRGAVTNFTVSEDCAPGYLVKTLGNPIGDLIKLNGAAIVKPVIKAGAIIQYYKGLL